MLNSATIVIEDLNLSGMAKNHGHAGAVLDCKHTGKRRGRTANLNRAHN
jgi:hypothetical protein